MNSPIKEIRMYTKHPQYRIRTISLTSNVLLESYLTEYPLFSSKYLNYLDWLKVLAIKKTRKYDQDIMSEVINQKWYE